MSDTTISWCDKSWNVVVGCTRVSAGCENCYIPSTPPFRMAGRRFDHPGIGGTTGVTLHPERLLTPLGWREPRRVFVNSLADVFHDEVPTELIARSFAVMSLAPQHTFLLLSKRPGRMRSLLGSPAFVASVRAHRAELLPDAKVARQARRNGAAADLEWPLPNLHLGVSVEDQDSANVRVPLLLETPAACRWLSCEPLLGPVDLRRIRTRREHVVLDVLAGNVLDTRYPREVLAACPSCIDWVVIGGESGPDARRMDLAWSDALIAQVGRTRSAYFKQTGSVVAKELGLRDRKGEDPDEWPEPWPRQFPLL